MLTVLVLTVRQLDASRLIVSVRIRFEGGALTASHKSFYKSRYGTLRRDISPPLVLPLSVRNNVHLLHALEYRRDPRLLRPVAELELTLQKHG